MTTEEYFQKCESHNWFYARSEKRNIVIDGRVRETHLRSLASGSEIFMKIYRDFYRWANDGDEKPELENYI